MICNWVSYQKFSLCAQDFFWIFRKTSLESSTCDQPSGGDDEIFFGPMGHTEKCVSKAVEDVVKEETMVKVNTSWLIVVMLSLYLLICVKKYYVDEHQHIILYIYYSSPWAL